MDTEAFIREKAKLNWSRAMVAGALGVGPMKLRTILEFIPGLKWCPHHLSADRQRAYHSRGRRGDQCPDYLRRNLEVARHNRRERAPKYTVGDFTGTTKEVFDHWEQYITVTYSQVRRRLKYIDNVYDVFFMNCQTHKGWGQNAKKLGWGKI